MKVTMLNRAACGRRRAVRLAVLASVAAVTCSPANRFTFQQVSVRGERIPGEFEGLAEAIGDRRIVLLGENGHGVGEFTVVKSRLVEWLHRELEFDVVVMESGYFECGHAWNRVAEITARAMLYDCLRYPFEHAEILPLFEYIRASHGSDRPLRLAGMDPQSQGYDSGSRPGVLYDALEGVDARLARRIAGLDSALFLVPDSGGLGDALHPWVLEHGEAAKAAYDSAAALTDGWYRWAFVLAGGLLDRLTVQARALRSGTEPPASYYELRDEWMARAVAAVADSIAGRRKVVVWLHNDHARYGDFASGDHTVRSVGGFLREWYGADVFSIGFFMGNGEIADNGRRRRTMAPMIEGSIEQYLQSVGGGSGYLVLSGNRDPAITQWASARRPYLRMGLVPMEMVPGDEFDALFYIDRVSPPDYAIPRR